MDPRISQIRKEYWKHQFREGIAWAIVMGILLGLIVIGPMAGYFLWPRHRVLGVGVIILCLVGAAAMSFAAMIWLLPDDDFNHYGGSSYQKSRAWPDKVLGDLLLGWPENALERLKLAHKINKDGANYWLPHWVSMAPNVLEEKEVRELIYPWLSGGGLKKTWEPEGTLLLLVAPIDKLELLIEEIVETGEQFLLNSWIKKEKPERIQGLPKTTIAKVLVKIDKEAKIECWRKMGKSKTGIAQIGGETEGS